MAEEFVRLVVSSRIDRDSEVAVGVVQVAYELIDREETPVQVREGLQRILSWLEEHMPEPTRFNRTSSKGWYRRRTRGIAWLRTSSTVQLDQLRALAALVAQTGFEVAEIRESRLGYRVYEDDVQVVAEPFRDTRTRS
jgi:hypothetical protein